MEHFSENDYDVFFANIKRYLKQGGYFTGALPNNLAPNFRMCPNCNHVFEIDGHLSQHTLDSLKNLFSEYKLEIIYLSTFNLWYYKKSQSYLKYLYRKLYPPTKGGGQLEFIVKSN